MPTLYVSDIDGTLVGDDGRLSAFSRSALVEMLGEGLVFTVASARSVVSIRQILEGVPLRLPVSEFNGAFISDLATGRHEVVNSIAPDVAEDIFGRMQRPGVSPLVSTFDGSRDLVCYDEIANAGVQWYVDDRHTKRDPRWEHDRSTRAALREQVVCLTLIGHEHELIDVESEIRDHHGEQVETHLFENPYHRGWYWLTVHDHRATKDRAVARLQEMYGLQDHELVAFGDQTNDIKLLQAADHGVAVGNAVPALKSVASEVIGTNEDDSVVRFIRRHRE